MVDKPIQGNSFEYEATTLYVIRHKVTKAPTTVRNYDAIQFDDGRYIVKASAQGCVLQRISPNLVEPPIPVPANPTDSMVMALQTYSQAVTSEQKDAALFVLLSAIVVKLMENENDHH